MVPRVTADGVVAVAAAESGGRWSHPHSPPVPDCQRTLAMRSEILDGTYIP
eukprot:CAMPEP_0182568210 /NCGR_PEP_ID=MMETSP1324-20130603/9230_1 /TAXON_ID=236786 /ORGANISM="Florenciella sp., Strain RCC1587" /LENGTH=50 /DNA_ID=CAMNT_0024782335 /DNA_START=128 /DNA_END=280 /DNA_ORIENTATION=+